MVSRKKRSICHRTHHGEPEISAWYVKKWLTYTTFRSSVYMIWKNAYNSNANFVSYMFRTSHKKGHHRNSELKLLMIATFFVDIYEIGNATFFTWPWPDLYYKLLKMASHDPMVTLIEFLGQSWPWNMCRTTYSWLENYRDLLWPSFDLEVYLIESHNSISTLSM